METPPPTQPRKSLKQSLVIKPVIMDDLPREVLASVLLKLPMISILRFRAVSKLWLEIIDDLSFRRSFVTKGLLVLGYRQRYGKAPSFYFLMRKGPTVMAKEMARVEGLKDYNLRNCCNGLFYFEKYDRGLQSAVFNPSTREVLKLPEAPLWKHYGSTQRALGFDCSTGTFKLVEIFLGTGEVGAATFNFKTWCWARCKAPRIPPQRIARSRVHATDTGTLYWHLGDNEKFTSLIDSPKQWPFGSYGQVIISFDMAKEEFRSSWFPKRVYSMHITEIKGRLAVCSYGVKYINIYGLVDYQSQNWVRLYRIPKPVSPQISVDLSSCGKTKMFATYSLGNEVKQFYMYDFENGELKRLTRGPNLSKGKSHGEVKLDSATHVYCVKPYLIPLTQL